MRQAALATSASTRWSRPARRSCGACWCACCGHRRISVARMGRRECAARLSRYLHQRPARKVCTTKKVGVKRSAQSGQYRPVPTRGRRSSTHPKPSTPSVSKTSDRLAGVRTGDDVARDLEGCRHQKPCTRCLHASRNRCGNRWLASRHVRRATLLAAASWAHLTMSAPTDSTNPRAVAHSISMDLSLEHSAGRSSK